MALTNYTYRLKAMPGDASPHDELGVSGNLGTGITSSLVDRGAGDVAWRFSAGATSIAIPGAAIDFLSTGGGKTFAVTLKVINSGSTSYRTYMNIGPDVLPLAHASASTSPGMSLARHGSSTLRATGLSTYTGNITAGTDDRTYVIKYATGKSGVYDQLEIWAYDPTNPTVALYIGGSQVNINGSNNATWDTLSIDCSSGVILEIKDFVFWPDEKTDAECASLAVNGIRASLDAVADTEAPVFTGTMTSNSITGSSFTLDWSGCVRTDNVGITSYETSSDNATWTNRGNVTSYNFTGLVPSTAYLRYVRALDAAGNFSTPSLSLTVTTSAVDNTLPVHTGVLTESNVTHNSFTVECPVATDNVAVAGYEATINGTDWTDLGTLRVYTYETASPNTAYTVQMRAYDTSGNRSTPALSKTITTLVAPDTYFLSAPLCDEAARPIQNATGWTVFISDVTTGALLYTKTGQSTNASGRLTIDEPLATKGTYYRLVYQRADGTPNPPEGMQTLMAV